MASLKSSVILFLCGLIIITEFQKGDARKCIQCDSIDNPDCAFNPGKIEAIECITMLPKQYREVSDIDITPITSTNTLGSPETAVITATTLTQLFDVGKEFANLSPFYNIFPTPNVKCHVVIAKNENGTTFVERGCALISKKCEDARIKVDVCEFCEEDGCNSSPLLIKNN